jgi:hypothetical protein
MHGLPLQLHVLHLDDVRDSYDGRGDLLLLVLHVKHLDAEVVGVRVDHKEDKTLLKHGLRGKELGEGALVVLANV